MVALKPPININIEGVINLDLKNVMDLKEASEKYNININTLKTICQRNKYNLIEDVDFKKTGRVWLITKAGVEKILEEKGN